MQAVERLLSAARALLEAREARFWNMRGGAF